MASIELGQPTIVERCYRLRYECEGQGHGETIWARRVLVNGSVQVRSVCIDCGSSTFTAKGKDHPRRSLYPEIKTTSGACGECRLCREAQERLDQFHAERQAHVVEIRQTAAGRSLHINDADWAAYLASAAWRERRSACHQRYGYRCAICNQSDELHAHHRTYERVTRELSTDLITLCRSCHALFHGYAI